jgi:hypothetical protein
LPKQNLYRDGETRIVRAARLVASRTAGRTRFAPAHRRTVFPAGHIGGEHRPAVYGKHQASHPVTIRRVYEEALTRFPEAADVIAALVFFDAVGRNREDFLQQIETEKAADR